MQSVSSMQFSSISHNSNCRFVCTQNSLNMNAGVAVPLRTYISSEDPGVDCMIWEAARAMSAAPTFFKGMKIGSQIHIVEM